MNAMHPPILACSAKTIACFFIVLWAVESSWAGSLEFLRQTISVPTQTKAWPAWQMAIFADIDNDGLDDLLAIGPAENKLWIFRQRSNGFSLKPDQILPLPPNTAWIAPCEVDKNPGVELLISSAAGLEYWLQERGIFMEHSRSFAAGNQVFTNPSLPLLIAPARFKSGTNETIPLIFNSEALIYQKDNAFQWSLLEKLPLESRRIFWTCDREDWTTGLQPSYSMRLRQSFLAHPIEGDEKKERKAEVAVIRKILHDMAKDDDDLYEMERVDINGDGQEDLIFWQISQELDPKTDLFLFLRGADGQIPKKPTQVLHCRGFPILIGPSQKVSPLCDLDGDGVCELVMMTLKNAVISKNTVVEMIFTKGVDWTLTVNAWKRGAFSKDQRGALNLTSTLPGEMGAQPLFRINGDFNRDGRPDLLVRRSAGQWNIYISAAGKEWFAPESAAALELPNDGYFEIRDLNRDRQSDLVVRSSQDSSLMIFLSRSFGEKARGR